MDKSYLVENATERERLRTLIARLSDEELSHPMPAGWTVAGVLAHMAFWDARALYYMDRWASGAAPSETDLIPDDIDWVNDSAKPLCLALPPRVAAQLALDIAEETDRRVAALPDDLLVKVLAVGAPFNLSRASHRGEHLDEIESHL